MPCFSQDFLSKGAETADHKVSRIGTDFVLTSYNVNLVLTSLHFI